MYTVADVKERISAVLDQLLMKWISKEGKDMFNLRLMLMISQRVLRQTLIWR